MKPYIFAALPKNWNAAGRIDRGVGRCPRGRRRNIENGRARAALKRDLARLIGGAR